jgi:hypothetical protein
LKIETWEAWAGFNMSHWSIAVHIDSVPWERISAQPAFHFVASEEGEEIKCFDTKLISKYKIAHFAVN